MAEACLVLATVRSERSASSDLVDSALHHRGRSPAEDKFPEARRAKHFARSTTKRRRVAARFFVGGSTVCVVVEGDRPASTLRRAVERIRVAVVGVIGRREDDEPVEDGQDALASHRHLTVPELEVPTPLVEPVLVEVDEDVEASIEVRLG